MGHPQKVKPITFNEMKRDPILSKLPLVKGSLQGINGRQIPKEYYDRLLHLLSEKGMATKNIPRLEDHEFAGIKFKNEKDVETHLLEPLLREMGFAPSDWERQVGLKVGRSEKAIPDYLIHVKKDKTMKSVKADWVWEAKFSIPNTDQLKKDFGQACSYAKLVEAKGVGLISKEGA